MNNDGVQIKDWNECELGDFTRGAPQWKDDTEKINVNRQGWPEIPIQLGGTDSMSWEAEIFRVDTRIFELTDIYHVNPKTGENTVSHPRVWRRLA